MIPLAIRDDISFTARMVSRKRIELYKLELDSNFSTSLKIEFVVFSLGSWVDIYLHHWCEASYLDTFCPSCLALAFASSRVGGNWNNGGNCGVFTLNSNNALSNANVNIGARFCLCALAHLRIAIRKVSLMSRFMETPCMAHPATWQNIYDNLYF